MARTAELQERRAGAPRGERNGNYRHGLNTHEAVRSAKRSRLSFGPFERTLNGFDALRRPRRPPRIPW